MKHKDEHTLHSYEDEEYHLELTVSPTTEKLVTARPSPQPSLSTTERDIAMIKFFVIYSHFLSSFRSILSLIVPFMCLSRVLADGHHYDAEHHPVEVDKQKSDNMAEPERPLSRLAAV